jgi:hypothetical protein
MAPGSMSLGRMPNGRSFMAGDSLKPSTARVLEWSMLERGKQARRPAV